MTAAPARARLPNRRPLITETLIIGNQAIEASVGFDPATGRPRELFLTGAKDGTNRAGFSYLGRLTAHADMKASIASSSCASSDC